MQHGKLVTEVEEWSLNKVQNFNSRLYAKFAGYACTGLLCFNILEEILTQSVIMLTAFGMSKERRAHCIMANSCSCASFLLETSYLLFDQSEFVPRVEFPKLIIFFQNYFIWMLILLCKNT